jgi:hypothetical protein
MLARKRNLYLSTAIKMAEEMGAKVLDYIPTSKGHWKLRLRVNDKSFYVVLPVRHGSGDNPSRLQNTRMNMRRLIKQAKTEG